MIYKMFSVRGTSQQDNASNANDYSTYKDPVQGQALAPSADGINYLLEVSNKTLSVFREKTVIKPQFGLHYKTRSLLLAQEGGIKTLDKGKDSTHLTTTEIDSQWNSTQAFKLKPINRVTVTQESTYEMSENNVERPTTREKSVRQVTFGGVIKN